MDASDFCFVCGTPGFFPAEDNLLCPDCTRVHAVDDTDVEIVDTMEYCQACFCHGEFLAEDSFLCSSCVRMAQPVDDEPYFGEETDAMFPEFLHECMMHGEFSSAYSFLCPECRAQMLVMAMAQTVSDDGEVLIIEGHFADRDSGDGCDDDDEGGEDND